jgi:hypothetical protein
MPAPTSDEIRKRILDLFREQRSRGEIPNATKVREKLEAEGIVISLSPIIRVADCNGIDLSLARKQGSRGHRGGSGRPTLRQGEHGRRFSPYRSAALTKTAEGCKSSEIAKEIGITRQAVDQLVNPVIDKLRRGCDPAAVASEYDVPLQVITSLLSVGCKK